MNCIIKKKKGKAFLDEKKLANTFPLEARYQSLDKYPHRSKYPSIGFSSTLQRILATTFDRSIVRSRDRCATL